VYAGLSDALGQPIGPVTAYEGFLVAPMEYSWLQCDPRLEDPHWRVAPASVVRPLMQKEGIQADSQPAPPPGLLTLIALQSARWDTLWLYGHPLTGVRRSEDRCRVFYEKAVFTWGCSSVEEDPSPSEITREKVGSLTWAPVSGGEDPGLEPQPWTDLRLVIAGIGMSALLLAAVGTWWGRRVAFE
jgi:hypothetical protein